MGVNHNLCWVFFLLILLISFSCSIKARTANLSTTWTNNPSLGRPNVRYILPTGSFEQLYACGFYCTGSCQSYFFAVFLGFGSTSQVVWCANRNNPVRENATLQLDGGGNLILRDVDRTIVWSTNTTGKSVAGLNMTDTGNLVLFDRNNGIVWQSFDHPTDSLVPGQKLVAGQKLTASVSSSNWTEGPISLSVTGEGLFALIDSNPPHKYYIKLVPGTKRSKAPSYVKFLNGSLAMFILSAEPDPPDRKIVVPLALSAQYMKLEPGGQLRVYDGGTEWKEVADLLTGYLGECNYPLVCGSYGICSGGECGCPTVNSEKRSYFQQVDGRRPNLGCSEITPLSCEGSQNHSFLELEDMNYFIFFSDLEDTDSESCKQACLKNCSCKAALFRYGTNSSNGICFLPTQLFSLMINEKEKTSFNSSAFIKVQIPVAPDKKTGRMAIILGSSLGASFVLLLVVGIWFLFWKKKDAEVDEEDYLDEVLGMPTRFSYEELKAATENFSRKLGQGGFGSVFEGTLVNGTKVAVKHLDGNQVKQSFLAEVQTIGSIHHINLVRLIGFSAEKSHKLLVYEYVCNGSLDKWIFRENHQSSLDWEIRRKIILEVAKGLAYLHEDCRHKIVHFDIKPQNILLDDNFCAKVADFGLSKLIDREQSQVVTAMRGTIGYLAPEWLSLGINEKVDVYSFGIVVLEILCGRKNVDRSQPEESMHLLRLFERKAEENQLFDLIDKSSGDMQLHEAEVMEMMKVAAWCLQSDSARRPSMSVVVKVLEGVMDVESNIDYNFLTPAPAQIPVVAQKEADSSPLLPSVLSGPR